MPKGTSKPVRGSTMRAASVTDLTRFEPITSVAKRAVDELISRGAVVVAVRATLVTLRRGAQTARVDNWGRVDWVH